MRVPYGKQNLFIACHEPPGGQFQGLGRLLRVLSRQDTSHLGQWDGLPLDLSRRRVLIRVLISGHGSETKAGFAASAAGALEPHLLRLASRCRLYLLGCGQGKAELLQTWAEGTGIPIEQAAGCQGETETAISTCLLLHLLEEGVDSIERWFPLWVRCNDALRPYFPEIRQAYADRGADPVVTLKHMERRLDLRMFREFLGVIDRHPEYLSGLAIPER